MKYDILSPDEFSIIPWKDFNTKIEAFKFFIKWRDSFKLQGYYSTVRNGSRKRIPLEDLKHECELIEL